MKLATAILAAAVLAPAFGQGPVKAQEPSVVTVRAKHQKVATQKAQAKRGNRWSSLTSIPGWLLNANDDIPSARERQGFSK